MYKVYCDSFLLYDDRIENLKIFEASVDLELNKTGSFNFTIYPDHPYFNFISKLKSIITVYQDDYLLFRGRVLNDEIGFYNEKRIECEGELAFFLDTIQRPYTYSGSVSGFLQQIITRHNEQLPGYTFTLGTVTVTDPNDYITRSSIDYKDSWTVINDGLIKKLGGYIRVRTSSGVRYIDYLSDFTTISPQKIEFAKNLLDMKLSRKGESIKTALIPLGAKIEDEQGNKDKRLTVESVNDGKDYIVDTEAAATYGLIFATNTWDDVTVASNLLTKGRAYLAQLVNPSDSIDLSAADLATIEQNVTSFHIGTYVTVTSNPHGINQNFLVSKLSINLLDPASNSLTLGGVVETLTEKTIHIVPQEGKDGKDGTDGNDGSTIWTSSAAPTSPNYTFAISSLSGVTGATPKIGDLIVYSYYRYTITSVSETTVRSGSRTSIRGATGSAGKDAAIQSETAPSDTSYMWLDISVSPPLLKRYDPDASEWVTVNDTTDIIYNLERNTEASIETAKESVLTTVSESYYLKDETDSLISQVSTELEQTKDAFSFNFTELKKDISDVASGSDAEFELIKRYIRFEDGKILLGQVGNELELKIANDRIQFLQNNAEVAYFTNNKFFVTDGEFTNSLKLGRFAFMPRENGNLSFKKVE